MDGHGHGSDFGLPMIHFVIHAFIVKTSFLLEFCISDAGTTSTNQQ